VPELTPTELLDPDVLLGVSRRTDAIGVLSVYVTTDLGSDAGLRAAGIDIRNRLRELRMRVDQEGPPQRARALSAGIDGLQDAIAAPVEPGVSGRGQVLPARSCIHCSNSSTRAGPPVWCSPRKTRRACWNGASAS
jgi:hypothetical protein